MKKIIIVCGLTAGFIEAVMMVITFNVMYRKDEFAHSMVVGYTTMIIAFSLIFIGIKNYRDKHNNGTISFGQAFKVGLLISLIASTIYVLTWAIEYNFFLPDFTDEYAAHIIKEAKATGTSQLELDKTIKEMASFKEMYKNPLLFVLLTYAEILPVGLIISLLGALILKKK